MRQIKREEEKEMEGDLQREGEGRNGEKQREGDSEDGKSAIGRQRERDGERRPR